MTTHKIPPAHLYLKPGEMSILEMPTLVTTILGSCVAVTLYNRRLEVAAISHALLPHCKRRTYKNNVRDLLHGECARCSDAFKYVDCAVSMMIEAFSRFGITADETQVQLYGGAKMIAAPKQQGGMEPVGLQNSNVAQKVIADHGLTLYAYDIGGAAGRKISFNTKTGNIALHKAVRNAPENQPADLKRPEDKFHGKK
ncbi:MAG: chemotaxis protein CheD [Deltaproteobacteria bacterium HGW-Deltaproteobacteria-6]|nr:MAG: chemotaxis protein CheD [Deltaproteobacteria bacterium HGW-Deltaproteobacteria-6]